MFLKSFLVISSISILYANPKKAKAPFLNFQVNNSHANVFFSVLSTFCHKDKFTIFESTLNYNFSLRCDNFKKKIITLVGPQNLTEMDTTQKCNCKFVFRFYFVSISHIRWSQLEKQPTLVTLPQLFQICQNKYSNIAHISAMGRWILIKFCESSKQILSAVRRVSGLGVACTLHSRVS